MLFALLFTDVNGHMLTVMKLRLCGSWEMEGRYAHSANITSLQGRTRAHCQMACARQPGCRAFNYRQSDGRCELLPSFDKCTEPDEMENYTFVHLAVCDYSPPVRYPLTSRNASLPSGTDWSWVAVTQDSVDTVTSLNFLTTRDGNYDMFVSLTFSEGFYALSWWSKSNRTTTIVQPNGRTYDCVNATVYLIALVENSFPCSWGSFTTGGRVPHQAVRGGPGPFFVTRFQCEQVWRTGYYDAMTLSFHHLCPNAVWKQSEILTCN